jgi:Ca2+-binding EF-hand superfamily protein
MAGILAPLVFTAEQEAKLRQLFDHLDHDHKGFITPPDVLALVAEFGHEIPAERAQELLSKMDPSKIGRIEWEPFVKGMAVILPKLIVAVVLIGAFRKLDSGKTGFIARADLERLVAESGFDVDRARLDALILEAKPGADGRIAFKAFLAVLVAHLRNR